MGSGFGFRVSVCGFRFSVSGFRVSGFGFRVSDFRFGVSNSGLRVTGFGFRFSDFGFRVSGTRFRGSGLGFRVLSFGLRVSGSGSGICASGVGVRLSERIVLRPACEPRLLLGKQRAGFEFWISGSAFLVSGSRIPKIGFSVVGFRVGYQNGSSFPQPESLARSAATRWRDARLSATPCSRVLLKPRLKLS